MTVHFPFEHTYAALPANFFARVVPTPVASPRLIKLNRPLAIHLGLDPDPPLREVALVDGDVERRGGERGEIADLDDFLGRRGSDGHEHPRERDDTCLHGPVLYYRSA